MIALATVVVGAIVLVVLVVMIDVQDRRPLDPPMPPPEPPPYRGHHRDWGQTTRLRPPGRPEN